MPSSVGNQRHSLIIWQSVPNGTGDTPLTVLPTVIDRLRTLNREDAARELSLAITHCEEAMHWLLALERRRGSA